MTVVLLCNLRHHKIGFYILFTVTQNMIVVINLLIYISLLVCLEDKS